MRSPRRGPDDARYREPPMAHETPLRNDPFLTHLTELRRQEERPKPLPERPKPLPGQPLQGPFEPHGATRSPENDLPTEPAIARPQKARTTIDVAVRRVLGVGDQSRKLSGLLVLVWAPWMLFFLMMLVWVYFRRHDLNACILFTIGVSMPSVVSILLGRATWKGISLGALGIMMCWAITVGVIFGTAAWRWGGWRQYWWMDTGRVYSRTSASTPALATSDAALIGFRVDDSDPWGGNVNGSAVDHARSAGYRGGKRIYCAAPVLDRSVAGIAGPVRVNYWAIGVDCCANVGSFACDDSREALGGFGVVMLEGLLGPQCEGCTAEAFRPAVEKAEAIHGFVSAPGALYVRWVQHPGSLKWHYFGRGWAVLFASCVVGFGAIALPGVLIWYYGLGKPGGPALDWRHQRGGAPVSLGDVVKANAAQRPLRSEPFTGSA